MQSLPISNNRTQFTHDVYSGFGAAILTSFIWASWLISVKVGANSAMTGIGLALIRYGVPACCFLIFTLRAWKEIRQVPLRLLIGICFGAGAPFFLLGAEGMKYAPIAHAGLLIPGTFPLFVSFIAIVFLKETINTKRMIGLVGILLGVIILLFNSSTSTQTNLLIGDAYFLAASACWAIFTVCLRLSGLRPLVAAGLFCQVTCIVLLLIAVINPNGFVATLTTDSLSTELMISQLMIQGVLVGLVTGFSYGYAVHKIGAENTTAIGALSPVLASLAAYPLLGESLTVISLIAMTFICCGVIYSSYASGGKT